MHDGSVELKRRYAGSGQTRMVRMNICARSTINIGIHSLRDLSYSGIRPGARRTYSDVDTTCSRRSARLACLVDNDMDMRIISKDDGEP